MHSTSVPLLLVAAGAVGFLHSILPDHWVPLTVLPVALAASAIGIGAVVGVLVSFTAVTLATFVLLTVAATIAGYQVKGQWLEDHGNTITALVLPVIGVAVFFNLF